MYSYLCITITFADSGVFEIFILVRFICLGCYCVLLVFRCYRLSGSVSVYILMFCSDIVRAHKFYRFLLNGFFFFGRKVRQDNKLLLALKNSYTKITTFSGLHCVLLRNRKRARDPPREGLGVCYFFSSLPVYTSLYFCQECHLNLKL